MQSSTMLFHVAHANNTYSANLLPHCYFLPCTILLSDVLRGFNGNVRFMLGYETRDNAADIGTIL